jgi:hypothetical protein
MRREKSLADGFGDPYGTLVEPGEYRCFYRGWERGYAFGTERTFCWFTIADDQMGAGKPVIRFYNPITKPFVPRSHNIARDFYAITGLRAPGNVKPDDYLLDCEVLAQVTMVNAKNSRAGRGAQQRDLGPPYSRIDAVLKVTIGTPPCMRERSGDAS